MKKEKMTDKEIIDFMNEVNLLTELDHPNIIKLFVLYEDNERFFLVTELCTGGDLYDEIITRKKLGELQASFMVKQITAAVSYMHKKKIVHRDIKLENILLESKRNDNIKIIEFGQAF